MQAGLLWTGGKPARSDFSGGANSRRDNTTREPQWFGTAHVVGVVGAGAGGVKGNRRRASWWSLPSIYLLQLLHLVSENPD